MNTQDLLNIAVLATGKSRTAICRQFQRKKWKINTLTVKKYIEMSSIDDRKDEIESQLKGSGFTVRAGYFKEE